MRESCDPPDFGPDAWIFAFSQQGYGGGKNYWQHTNWSEASRTDPRHGYAFVDARARFLFAQGRTDVWAGNPRLRCMDDERRAGEVVDVVSADGVPCATVRLRHKRIGEALQEFGDPRWARLPIPWSHARPLATFLQLAAEAGYRGPIYRTNGDFVADTTRQRYDAATGRWEPKPPKDDDR